MRQANTTNLGNEGGRCTSGSSSPCGGNVLSDARIAEKPTGILEEKEQLNQLNSAGCLHGDRSEAPPDNPHIDGHQSCGPLISTLRSVRLRLDASIATLVGASSWISLQLTTSHCLECWATRLLPAALVAAVAGYCIQKYNGASLALRQALRSRQRSRDTQDPGLSEIKPSKHKTLGE